MATANIIRAWKDNTNAYIAVTVTESQGNVEYTAWTPLVDDKGVVKLTSQLKSELTTNVAAVRNTQMNPPQTISAITGTITI